MTIPSSVEDHLGVAAEGVGDHLHLDPFPAHLRLERSSRPLILVDTG